VKPFFRNPEVVGKIHSLEYRAAIGVTVWREIRFEKRITMGAPVYAGESLGVNP
jgi:hypothetical protein